eukprot:TRINITY_DN10316_c0_g1_i1.p1 TRINITY_DN10316_c0_g1~~TRINITY_DN10316_c0_g1_i1.p1  ORF type:complete len:434 (+),score=63.92 TRINITY_DN10316_c0_g1_i1:80-1381(+)
MVAHGTASIASFWILGLLNNFLYVAMNAGANNINEAGVGLVYLANVLPSLAIKVTAPYWFHFFSYRVRIWICASLMVGCLFVVAWGRSAHVKLLGVALAATQSGIGEASLLAMTSFYDTQKCLTAWSSGTGFAGIAGYLWSIMFDALDTCFQVQLMVALWIPCVWLLTFHCVLTPPWIDSVRKTTVNLGEVCDGMSDEADSSEADTETSSVGSDTKNSEPVTANLSCAARFRFVLGLWPYMVPLMLVYAAEYTIQAGFWAAMGFPVTDTASRHAWYKWANFTYQVGVFISRTTFVLLCKSQVILWLGAILQVFLVFFFWAAAATPFGSWWLLAPALVVGFMGGGVYVGAFCLINRELEKQWVELALTSASLADSLGIIIADILGIIVQGCMFGKLGVLDTKPDFSCGYTIWDNLTAHVKETSHAAHCFPGVVG